MKKIQTLSDNRQLIEGKQATELNKVAKEYVANKALLDDLTKTVKHEADTIKALGAGKFETNSYLIDIDTRAGSKTVDKKTLQILYPDVFADERIWTNGASSLVLRNVEAKV